jgi:AcrR family transcriptional regulator
MSQADETRKRILDAATEEFARHGIAGARVDRIASISGMSKPMIYTYFGPKDRLFDVVFDSHVVANSDRVPFTPDDLPGYAVRLYDDYLTDPALVRLIMWKRLERDEAGYLFGGHESRDQEHLDRLVESQRNGTVRPDLEPDDIWSLLISTAATWAQNSIIGVATNSDAAAKHERRRRALRAVIADGLMVRSS